MKVISVAVDDETHRLARIKAAQKGTSMSVMLRDYLPANSRGGRGAASRGNRAAAQGENAGRGHGKVRRGRRRTERQ